MKKKPELRIIKKYQNRRLYDTATSTYIVIDDIKQMITGGDLVKVIDVKTDTDVTRSVLLQIILEEETNKVPTFSDDFLFQIIRFYGKAFQPAISPFLEQGIEMLKQTQRQFYTQLKQTNRENLTGTNFEMWQEFWHERGPAVQQNIFNYLANSTTNFIHMQEQVQEQMQAQAESFLNLLKFPFNKGK
ncbi:MAG: polyhydroxyalkanoate synthesis repressor PhaR [Pseudomonadota bacterium]|jgi:polyhydroxyalkanoate synthesis repressor PhaR